MPEDKQKNSKQNDAKQEWEKYCERELAEVRPILSHLGFELDEHQPHLAGERYLMQAVTTASGKKLILLGRRTKDGKRVVIKTTSDTAGMREILHERKCREALKKMKFAYGVFFSPEEILFTKRSGRMIFIQAFIDQGSAFLERPQEVQFHLLLKGFKAQESAHATTYAHLQFARANFGSINSKGYLRSFTEFKSKILAVHSHDKTLRETLPHAEKFLEKNSYTIEQYSGFLTHVDFVPHNIRIADGNIYLLDHSAFRFGNKYEGWARCVNFMELYNPPLARTLVQYVHNNRTKEESLSLRLMRIYRLGEIVWYYTNTLSKSSGNLLLLNTARVKFWTQVLESVIDDKPLAEEILEGYKRTRDTLRSSEEKIRQVGLH